MSEGIKLLSNISFRLRDAVDKVSREEQCGLRKDRGCVDRMVTLKEALYDQSFCQKLPSID